MRDRHTFASIPKELLTHILEYLNHVGHRQNARLNLTNPSKFFSNVEWPKIQPKLALVSKKWREATYHRNLWLKSAKELMHRVELQRSLPNSVLPPSQFKFTKGQLGLLNSDPRIFCTDVIDSIGTIGWYTLLYNRVAFLAMIANVMLYVIGFPMIVASQLLQMTSYARAFNPLYFIPIAWAVKAIVMLGLHVLGDLANHGLISKDTWNLLKRFLIGGILFLYCYVTVTVNLVYGNANRPIPWLIALLPLFWIAFIQRTLPIPHHLRLVGLSALIIGVLEVIGQLTNFTSTLALIPTLSMPILSTVMKLLFRMGKIADAKGFNNLHIGHWSLSLWMTLCYPSQLGYLANFGTGIWIHANWATVQQMLTRKAKQPVNIVEYLTCDLDYE